MKRLLFFLSLAFLSCSCKNDPEPQPQAYTFAKGADISWITDMESKGIKFYNSSGEQRECTTLMKELGMNSIRLRVWVDPTTDGWCGKSDVLEKARRANNLGMRIMIDFHYSNYWADPSKQNKPAAWAQLSFNDLVKAVTDHTTDILNALKAANITPEWIQIGNETTDGMLWDDGKASLHMAQYAKLHQAGYNAAKNIFPKSQVIVHIDNGWKYSTLEWILDGLRSNGGRWDIIGVSLYPAGWDKDFDKWEEKTAQCLTNIPLLVSRYNTNVMICEVGMNWNYASACKAFLTELITKGRALPDNQCLGVFYWEPESNSSWNNYQLGAFDATYKPTIAMEAFAL